MEARVRFPNIAPVGAKDCSMSLPLEHKLDTYFRRITLTKNDWCQDRAPSIERSIS
jgi:hypothetical protein